MDTIKFPEVGTIVKSYDFPGSTEDYFIGKVTKIEGDFIHCKTIKHVAQGKTRPIDEYTEEFRTPAQGTGIFDDKFERVVEVG